MHVTHLGHSCVLIDHDGTRVLFDPGNLSSGFDGLTGLDAILITHQHPDHADPAALPALVAANPDAVRYADPQTAAQLADLGAGDVHRWGRGVRLDLFDPSRRDEDLHAQWVPGGEALVGKGCEASC